MEQYSEEQIRSKLWGSVSANIHAHFILEACQTYRKTIAAREKTIRTPVKRKKQMRSRKQRVSLMLFQ